MSLTPELTALLARARVWADSATPAEKAEMARQQMHSYVSSEMAFGSDADEAAYSAAHAAGDEAEMERLNAEAEARRVHALQIMDERWL